MDSLTSWFSTFGGGTGGPPQVGAAVAAMLGAFLFAQVLAWCYERTYRGISYSVGFNHTLILGSVSASLLVFSMQRSLIAGIGLLAAVSIIRFRSTLKSPRDLVFMMGALTFGIASGIGATAEAAAGCLLFCLIAFYLNAAPFGSHARFDGVLRFRTPVATQVEGRVEPILDRCCRRHLLLSVAEVAQGSFVEHAYQIKFRSMGDREALITSLREELDVRDVRMLMQDAALEV